MLASGSVYFSLHLRYIPLVRGARGVSLEAAAVPVARSAARLWRCSWSTTEGRAGCEPATLARMQEGKCRIGPDAIYRCAARLVCLLCDVKPGGRRGMSEVDREPGASLKDR